MPRGRPRSVLQAWEYHLHLRLRIGEDDDLIAYLGRLPLRGRALALKAALRSGGMARDLDKEADLEVELLESVEEFLK